MILTFYQKIKTKIIILIWMDKFSAKLNWNAIYIYRRITIQKVRKQ